MPLTDSAIRKAKPRDKPRKLYDSRGLYLEIAPRGTKAARPPPPGNSSATASVPS